MSCAGCLDCNVSAHENHHEIHITVHHSEEERFKQVCNELNVKAIVVHTESDGKIIVEPMTSIKFVGSTADAMERAYDVFRDLQKEGIRILRVKIETSPDNIIVDFAKGYWECHLQVPVDNKDENNFRGSLTYLADCYVSHNLNKIRPDGLTYMITIRGDGNLSKDDFKQSVVMAKKILNADGFHVEREILEYCWYDTTKDQTKLEYTE